MSRYRDDGSTWSGIAMVAICVICFCAGWTAHEKGIRFKVTIPQAQEVRK
ncbi:hypothetical protein [Phormidesmis sp. 146-33]